MAETVKVGFALKPETVERIERIAELTFRSKSDVVDWAVAEAENNITAIAREKTQLVEVLEPAKVGE
jgi:predicted transcriptional regulator